MSALKGYRVVELAGRPAGEYCGKLLADFGAEVIKIEPPEGSATRHLGPFPPGHDGDGERSTLFAYLNTGKRSAVLDLADAGGRATLSALVATADVLIDDHPTGWLRDAGLDPATLRDTHPRLIACLITPFGQNPPADRIHAEDLTIFHASGWGYHTPTGADPATPPLKPAGRFLVSYEAGLEAAMVVAGCLYGREETGHGELIDLSQQEVMAARVDYVLGQMIAGDMDVGDSRTQFDLSGPAGIFACREGHAYIWMSTPGHWEAVRTLLGDPAWMRAFPDNWLERGLTPERIAECRGHIAAWLAGQDRHEVSAAAQKLGLTLVAVNDASDLPKEAQYAHRGFFAEAAHPHLGTALYPTVPYRMSATPAAIVAPAPLLGEYRS